MIKMSPKRVRICPGCPHNDLNLDTTPQFKFVNSTITNTPKITTLIGNNKKNNSKVKSLF